MPRACCVKLLEPVDALVDLCELSLGTVARADERGNLAVLRLYGIVAGGIGKLNDLDASALQ